MYGITQELREMIELAALAVGMEIKRCSVDPNGYSVQEKDLHGCPYPWRPWAPNADDGDSRRLEVVLGMDVIQHSKLKDGRQEVAVFHGNLLELEPHGNDPLAATRMAVLRCAAEVGLAIKEKSNGPV
jgi:hypothetical protein